MSVNPSLGGCSRFEALRPSLRSAGPGNSAISAECRRASQRRAFSRDVNAAIQRAVEERAPRARRVGSSLARLWPACRFRQPCQRDGLVHPGQHQGPTFTGRMPMSELPTFIAAAAYDTMARIVARAGKMAMAVLRRPTPVNFLAPFFFGKERRVLQDLEAWLMSVHDEVTRARSLYYSEVFARPCSEWREGPRPSGALAFDLNAQPESRVRPRILIVKTVICCLRAKPLEMDAYARGVEVVEAARDSTLYAAAPRSL